jgi:hypothetical protein
VPSHTRARRGMVTGPSVYSPCLICGIQCSTGVCPHHTFDMKDRWSEANRIWCGYFHRGDVIERVTEDEDDQWYWRVMEAGCDPVQ